MTPEQQAKYVGMMDAACYVYDTYAPWTWRTRHYRKVYEALIELACQYQRDCLDEAVRGIRHDADA